MLMSSWTPFTLQPMQTRVSPHSPHMPTVCWAPQLHSFTFSYDQLDTGIAARRHRCLRTNDAFP